jgi:hypothetical protein
MTLPRSPLKKVTIRLESNQYQELRRLYPNVGYNGIIRALVDKHLRAMRVRVAEQLAKLSPEAPVDGLEDLLNIPPQENPNA